MFPSRDRSARRLVVACALAAATAGAAAPAASATNNDDANQPVSWTISFTDSVMKNPSDMKPDRASFERSGKVGLTGAERPVARLVRAGSIIDIDSSGDKDNWGKIYRPELLPGDVFQVLDAQTGVLYAEAAYDGRPSLEASTCAGSANGFGLRSENASITGVGEYANVKNPWKYKYDPAKSTTGMVTNAAPGSFEVVFKRPLAAGHLVWAETTRAAGPSLTVTSYSERFVGSCPPPPVITPVDTTAPIGTATALKTAKTMRSLRKFGVRYIVKSDTDATVTSALSLETTVGKGKKRKVRATVVGTSSSQVAAGGQVQMVVKIQKKQQGRVQRAVKAKSVRLRLSTKLTDAAGNTSALPTRTVKLPTR